MCSLFSLLFAKISKVFAQVIHQLVPFQNRLQFCLSFGHMTLLQKTNSWPYWQVISYFSTSPFLGMLGHARVGTKDLGIGVNVVGLGLGDFDGGQDGKALLDVLSRCGACPPSSSDEGLFHQATMPEEVSGATSAQAVRPERRLHLEEAKNFPKFVSEFRASPLPKWAIKSTLSLPEFKESLCKHQSRNVVHDDIFILLPACSSFGEPQLDNEIRASQHELLRKEL